MNELKKKWYLDFDYSKNGVYWTRLLLFTITMIIGIIIVSLITNTTLINAVDCLFIIGIFIWICGKIGEFLDKHGYKIPPIGPMRK